MIGLLTSPVAVTMAQAACNGHASMTVAMASMPGMAQADTQKADPCCDPAKDTGQGKHKSTDCAQACATMCVAVAALPNAPAPFLAPPARDASPQARVASLKPHEPSRLERPPRSIV